MNAPHDNDNEPTGHNGGWIGVDLDGTLAEYHGWKGMNYIGPAVPKMLARVKQWLAEGWVVKIVTARIQDSVWSPQEVANLVHAWLGVHGLPPLEVTATKDLRMVELWDDRAVQVIPNTGLRADGQPG
ncbi:hypothetical protein M2322_002682 [Rhodoblastus acidophilus]|uniref:hypothetical protein n=1 Tax=Rhodoblastus acidophilus TaxID=1074 RepID=UPI002224D753|nr:hypothetical protein [Rhodoblastus acidophilus]MCW2317128.1 hypothetical protein [Rhodoblastus acidophilus]